MKPAPKFPKGYIPEYREVAGTDYSGQVRAPKLSDLLRAKERHDAAERDSQEKK